MSPKVFCGPKTATAKKPILSDLDSVYALGSVFSRKSEGLSINNFRFLGAVLVGGDSAPAYEDASSVLLAWLLNQTEDHEVHHPLTGLP